MSSGLKCGLMQLLQTNPRYAPAFPIIRRGVSGLYQCGFGASNNCTAHKIPETMEANNKATLSENKTAIERLIASNERFRSDIEKAVGELRTTTERNSRVLLLEIAGVMGLGVAVISLIVGLIVS